MEHFENSLPEKPCERAMHIAARCWCDPETEKVEMDSRLALAFAKRIHAMMAMVQHYNEHEFTELDPDSLSKSNKGE